MPKNSTKQQTPSWMQFPTNKKIANIIGVDEVGMGSLAGPVVVCAVQFPAELHETLKIGDYDVRDSKQLSPAQRETIANTIKKLDIRYALAYSYPKTIDKLNIYQSARAAMRRSIKNLVLSSKLNTKYIIPNTIILVDGPHKIPRLNMPQQAIIKGDQKIFAIACASIIAKVYRDHMMQRYAKKYPQYGFEKHKGYGTALHYANLATYGPCTLHRKSFTIQRS